MTDPKTVRIIARITGNVQGVFYRATARREAMRLGLSGWARNETDGSVLIDVEGDAGAIEAFLAWCAVGPPAAKVEAIEQSEAAPVGRQGFTID